MLHAIPQLQDYLIHSAARLGDKIALVCDKKRYTYAELDAQSNALAHTLVQQGVTRGDRVVVFADNSVETVIAFWAVLKANAVVSVVNPLTKTDKLRYLLEDCRATALIADGLLSRVLAPVVADNKHLKVLIMTGAGRAFCAGADINEFKESGKDPAFQRFLNKKLIEMARAYYEFEKPVIGAINGVSAGDGSQWVLAFDLNVASEKARFGWPATYLGIL